MNFKETLAEKTVHAEDVLTKYLPEEKGYQKKVIESMNYSVLAGGKRLRPILMTGISTVAGAIPLLIATGAGAVSRRCLGAVVFYGGTSACFLTLFIVPIGYLLLARREKSPHALMKYMQQLDRENPARE